PARVLIPLMMPNRLAMWIAILAALPGVGRAEPGALAQPISYALVVAGNRGGSGQAELRYAEEDAQRVVEVLTELGGYAPSNIRFVRQPHRADVLRELDELNARLLRHKEHGDKAT